MTCLSLNVCRLASVAVTGLAIAITAASLTGPRPAPPLAEPAAASTLTLPTDSYGIAASGGAAAAISVLR